MVGTGAMTSMTSRINALDNQTPTMTGEELYPRLINFDALLEKETADSGLQNKPQSNLVTSILMLVIIGVVFLYIMSAD